ncbi:MAG: HAD family hydrolase [Haloarculaceae archaeon]
MMAAVDTVLFDVDDTLCEYRRATGEVLELAFERAGVEPFFPVAAYLDRYSEFADEADTVADLRTACFSTIAAERGYDPERGREVAAAFTAERDHRNVRALPGLDDALDALSTAGYRVGVVTNGAPEMQRQKLDALDLRDRFEVVVHGGYDAPAKPAPDPFHRALDRLGGDPGRAVHVGNSLASDVAGAQAAGLRAAWLRQHDGDPDPAPDYTVDSLHDLTTPPWE